ncbi:hypothetical protein AAFF_G00085440 [Aldrovandia affinis]|uniref:Uncharacterized protein n=1 Tax=Aldrovandia affinis TaxID=143900 RepID=A0AAD7RWX1_9TELE|nr:hypothetical protein AAFF_G00085440 [Aldrovandia affinis]
MQASFMHSFCGILYSRAGANVPGGSHTGAHAGVSRAQLLRDSLQVQSSRAAPGISPPRTWGCDELHSLHFRALLSPRASGCYSGSRLARRRTQVKMGAGGAQVRLLRVQFLPSYGGKLVIRSGPFPLSPNEPPGDSTRFLQEPVVAAHSVSSEAIHHQRGRSLSPDRSLLPGLRAPLLYEDR